MRIIVTKLTDISHARRALATTVGKEFESTATLDQIYTWMHSPIRTQIFDILMEDIPSFVSVHFVRHKIGVEHFVTSKRTDRGGNGTEDRNTPVDHRMLINAEALMTMANKRLCYKASKETREVMNMIWIEMLGVDLSLCLHMFPSCVVQGGYCREPKPCGKYKVKQYDPTKIWEDIS